MKKSNIFLFFILSLSIFSNVYASPYDDLVKTQKEISKANKLAKNLEDEEKTLKIKYVEISTEMTKTAIRLQVSEARLSAIEEKLRILNKQITERVNILVARKKDLAVMVQAAIKLSQTPPEAVILMPGDMRNNMKASRALKMTVDSIKYQAQSINEQMLELESLRNTVAKNQEEAVAEREQLGKQQLLLKSQISEHRKLQKKLNIEQKKVKDRVQFLAKKAKDLQDFIASIEREAQQEKLRQQQEIKADISKPEGEKGELRSFKSAKGNIRIPAAGRLSQKYGIDGKNGATSKGVIITTRAKAQVTAPYDGEVIFAGLFMEYGKIIILRHSDDFHTLLAGMTKIDVSVGEFLLEGEPIGAMGDNETDNRLYMELRFNNQPIDPAPWIRGLNR